MSRNGKTKLLTRDQILSRPDVPSEDIEIPEWKGVVRVRGMTVAERTAWEKSNVRSFKGRNGQMVTEVNQDAITNFRQRLVALCVIDENGNRVFSDADIISLEKKSASAIERIVNVANRLNGVTREELEQLEGNSEATGIGEQGSDSQPSSDAPSLN